MFSSDQLRASNDDDEDTKIKVTILVASENLPHDSPDIMKANLTTSRNPKLVKLLTW